MTRMWEAVAAAGRADELIAWALEATSGRPAEVYSSADARVVILLHDPDAGDLPAAPDDLLARPPHAWEFSRVLP